MKAEIKTFINSEIFSCNCYVIHSEKCNIVIDSWFYDWTFKEYLQEIGWVDAIFLTHGHGDHIRAVDEIINDYPKAKVYIHIQDKALLNNTELNCSFLVWRKAIQIKSQVNFFDEWELSVWWFNVKIIHLPWHTDWCSMFYFEELNSLFLWDVVMWDTVWTLRTPTWDLNKMQASLWKFKHLWLTNETQCYPWHWEKMSYWEILRINPFLNMR